MLGAVAAAQQCPHRFAFPPGAGLMPVLAAQQLARRSHRVERVGLGAVLGRPPGRPIETHHPLPRVSGSDRQPSTVGTGALD